MNRQPLLSLALVGGENEEEGVIIHLILEFTIFTGRMATGTGFIPNGLKVLIFVKIKGDQYVI
jgi:hypothetical protein